MGSVHVWDLWEDRMRVWMLVLGLMMVAGSASAAEPKMVVLDYGDFGPQAAAFELLGMDGCAWLSHQDVPGPEACVVKVVVFRGTDAGAVAKKYPVVRKTFQDYRYVEWDRAVKYLDEWIAEDVVPATTARLKKARATLK